MRSDVSVVTQDRNVLWMQCGFVRVVRGIVRVYVFVLVVVLCCRVAVCGLRSGHWKHFVIPIVCCHLLSGILSLCVFVRRN